MVQAILKIVVRDITVREALIQIASSKHLLASTVKLDHMNPLLVCLVSIRIKKPWRSALNQVKASMSNQSALLIQLAVQPTINAQILLTTLQRLVNLERSSLIKTKHLVTCVVLATTVLHLHRLPFNVQLAISVT